MKLKDLKKMKMEIIKKKPKYSDFWQWFLKNRFEFEVSNFKEESIQDMDNRILTMGDFAWEIGPGKLKRFSLSISPGGDKLLIGKTKEIVAEAPILNDWEFNYAKPEKEWDNYFESIWKNRKVEIEISSWKYILYKYEKGVYDIEIFPFGIKSEMLLDKDHMQGLAEMVVQSLIGEEKRLTRINGIEVRTDLPLTFESKETSILLLKEHLNKLE